MIGFGNQLRTWQKMKQIIFGGNMRTLITLVLIMLCTLCIVGCGKKQNPQQINESFIRIANLYFGHDGINPPGKLTEVFWKIKDNKKVYQKVNEWRMNRDIEEFTTFRKKYKIRALADNVHILITIDNNDEFSVIGYCDEVNIFIPGVVKTVKRVRLSDVSKEYNYPNGFWLEYRNASLYSFCLEAMSVLEHYEEHPGWKKIK